MSDSWYKAEIFMDWPLELHYLVGVIFNLEVKSFLFLDNTVSEIDFVLLLERQVLEQNVLVIGFSLNFKSVALELVQQGVGSDFPLLYAWLFRFEFNVEDSIGFGRQS